MLTPASPADLPPLGELVADDPFWRYSPAAMPGDRSSHALDDALARGTVDIPDDLWAWLQDA